MSASDLWKASFCCAVVLFCLMLSSTVEAVDKEDCLMCHKYRFMGRIDANGKRHNYYVSEHIYGNSLHKNVACNDCHTAITKLPHDPVPKEVNCGTECHIRPPFTQQNFSHRKIIDIYNSSVHAIKPDDSPALRQAKPYCKFCHLNPVYTRLDENMVSYDVTLKRCLNCHEKQGVTQAYIHITHRLRRKTSRSPQEIVALCSKCHADVAMLKRVHAPEESLDAVETYNRSIHGKSVMLGSQVAADCISCHASNALHDIYEEENPKATINKENLAQTCRQCHKQTNRWFVQVAVHPRVKKEKNPVVFFAGLFFRFMLYGAVFGMVGLMLFETYGRRSRGVKFLLKNGTSWRGKSKVKDEEID
jgi:nitrate/TMAO reductase-like tetraheme cytochrome c subunit